MFLSSDYLEFQVPEKTVTGQYSMERWCNLETGVSEKVLNLNKQIVMTVPLFTNLFFVQLKMFS